MRKTNFTDFITSHNLHSGCLTLSFPWYTILYIDKSCVFLACISAGFNQPMRKVPIGHVTSFDSPTTLLLDQLFSLWPSTWRGGDNLYLSSNN